MKICFVCDSYKPIYDGVVRYFDYLIPELVKAGHEVTLVGPWFIGTEHYEYPFEGFEVVRCTSTRIYTQGYWIAYPDKRLLKAVRNADFVFVHSVATLGVFGALLARILRKKIGIFIHQDERIVLWKILQTPKVWYNVSMIALSQIYYQLFIDVFFHATERFKGKLIDFGISEEKIFHTPFAIDKSRFNPKNNQFDIRTRHNIPSDAIVSIYVGRLAKEKNVANMLEGMDRALEEEPNLYGLFVGKGPEWDYYANHPYKNKDRMIFTGFVPDVELPSHYVAADFFTNPSLNESSCFTVFEAMSCCLPVITSEYRHDPDVKHKENTILVSDIMNPDEIKDSILLIARDKELRKKLAINGEKLVDGRTWENHVKQFIKGVEYALRTKWTNKRIKSMLKPKYPHIERKKRRK
ncbi:MAG: glycosyltransferase family 4 protein [Candidatus Heimdallarchaeota archaeon]